MEWKGKWRRKGGKESEFERTFPNGWTKGGATANATKKGELEGLRKDAIVSFGLDRSKKIAMQRFGGGGRGRRSGPTEGAKEQRPNGLHKKCSALAY
jgi:hypothetical protein